MPEGEWVFHAFSSTAGELLPRDVREKDDASSSAPPHGAASVMSVSFFSPETVVLSGGDPSVSVLLLFFTLLLHLLCRIHPLRLGLSVDNFDSIRT